MNPEDVALPPHQSILIPIRTPLTGNDRTQMTKASRPPAIPEVASSLSTEYRKLMRWYPAEWRAANEDAMLGVLLDQADNELRSTPTRSERASLFRAGIAQRFGFPHRGQRLRLLPLSVGALLSVFYAALIVWAPGSNDPGSVGPFSNPSIVTCFLLVAAFFAAVLIRGKAAGTLALVAVGVEIAIGILSSANHWQGPSWTAVALFAGIGILSGSTFRQGWSLTIGTFLVAAIAATTIIVSWVAAGLGQFSIPSVIATIATVLLVLIAVALLIRRVRRVRRASA